LDNIFYRQEKILEKVDDLKKKGKKIDPRIFLLMDDCLSSKKQKIHNSYDKGERDKGGERENSDNMQKTNKQTDKRLTTFSSNNITDKLKQNDSNDQQNTHPGNQSCI
jgi:hypothetical protein